MSCRAQIQGWLSDGDGAGLALEALAEGFGHHFDGNLPAESRIDGFVNLAHASGGDETENAKSARQHLPFGKFRDGAEPQPQTARLPTGGVERKVPAWSCSASSRSTSARRRASEHCSLRMRNGSPDPLPGQLRKGL